MGKFLTIINRCLRMFSRLAIYLACATITVFILANSYETAFGRTLPYVHAVSKVDLNFIQPGLAKYVPSLGDQNDSYYLGNYGVPLQMKVSGSSVPIPLAAPLYYDGWLAQSSTAHFIVISPAKTGKIGDMIVYLTSSKTTISDVAKIASGSNVFVDTKQDWRYFYRVDEVVDITSPVQKYVVPASTSSRLFIVIQNGSAHTVIAATLTNVQNANQ